MAINYKQCINCESKNTLNLLYGMPTDDASKQAKEGKFKLGGCCVIVGGPEYCCNVCESEWNKEQAIDAAYEKIIGLNAYVGGFFGASYNVDLDLISGSAAWSHWENGEEVASECKALKETTVKKLIEELKIINFLNWKREYIEPGVLDGTSWSVELIREGRNLKRSGANKFPEEWDDFCKLVRRMTGKRFS
ncbi:hypothetical protein [Bacillus suaedae]|uniref:Uncharacterized protein n=1 Tax=Halalkalibacter suaedae TaxID=2822140 RepID=A0A940WZW7_9BACI|nr:hypothetical protein [Bacillus suaedae]MBP3951936.1 hypothetical protein [Bacillus suaedae]